MQGELKYYKNPPGGIPAIVDSEKSLAQAISQLAETEGALAIDAERASGYTYSQQAYLLQLKKPDTPTFLIDPTLEINYQDLKNLINESAWILHAATQDLPCLYQFDLKPKEIFDTEVAARLLELPRVGLAGLLEDRLQIAIDKAHSAVNWASRPLKIEWLSYAALDVEFLHTLQSDLTEQLIAQEKIEVANQVFSELLQFQPNPPRPEAWRGTSGIHKLTSNREAAIVSELWQVRDKIARESNLAPHRVIRDEKIISLAIEKPKTEKAFFKILSNKQYQRDHLQELYVAYVAALEIPPSLWPPRRR